MGGGTARRGGPGLSDRRDAARESRERYAQLYLVFGNRELAGPGALRLAELIQAVVRETCPIST
jgi:hypothetical protein